ncbi:unnamed protein product [Prorocentrum cordatum]|uniref:UBC core domain-containing protein n=1 Tax=Prorocentrum cordatum TaxID=2364126 RepID=A0ABN9T745_9DINO|nr:unnamed protein product [Polarella glacialis]
MAKWELMLPGFRGIAVCFGQEGGSVQCGVGVEAGSVRLNMTSSESSVTADTVNASDLTHWKGILKGPEGTPYEGGVYTIDIKIPGDYPYNPPKMNVRAYGKKPNSERVCETRAYAGTCFPWGES